MVSRKTSQIQGPWGHTDSWNLAPPGMSTSTYQQQPINQSLAAILSWFVHVFCSKNWPMWKHKSAQTKQDQYSHSHTGIRHWESSTRHQSILFLSKYAPKDDNNNKTTWHLSNTHRIWFNSFAYHSNKNINTKGWYLAHLNHRCHHHNEKQQQQQQQQHTTSWYMNHLLPYHFSKTQRAPIAPPHYSPHAVFVVPHAVPSPERVAPPRWLELLPSFPSSWSCYETTVDLAKWNHISPT